ncbi:MAG TPA: CBS domain-containing protein, partial [Dehalococcoidia bacterium]|nr:CBS domain-containing protein [Dehalococcoidia bacterium]
EICDNCGRDLAGLDIPGAVLDPGVSFVYEELSKLPRKPPLKVSVTDPVGRAVRHMQHEGADCLLVMDGDSLAGIITLWDVLHKVAGPDRDLNAITCGEIMTADPVFLREDDNIGVAINKMSVGGFRHIPLLEGGTPISVVSINDVFQHISANLV